MYVGYKLTLRSLIMSLAAWGYLLSLCVASLLEVASLIGGMWGKGNADIALSLCLCITSWLKSKTIYLYIYLI